MSHVVTCDIVILDLDALEQAAAACGLQLVRGQTTWKWYGRWVNDYHAADAAYKHGIDPKEYGQCVHALVQTDNPGAYQVGVRANPDGPGYVLVYDFYDRTLRPKIGGDGEVLRQAYLQSTLRREAVRQRSQVIAETRLPDGRVEVRVRCPKRG